MDGKRSYTNIRVRDVVVEKLVDIEEKSREGRTRRTSKYVVVFVQYVLEEKKLQVK